MTEPADEDIFHSVITCPACGHQRREAMLERSCQIVYHCTGCGAVLRPLAGDWDGDGTFEQSSATPVTTHTYTTTGAFTPVLRASRGADAGGASAAGAVMSPAAGAGRSPAGD